MSNAAQAILTVGLIGGATYLIARSRQQSEAIAATPASFTVTTTRSNSGGLKSGLLGALGGILSQNTRVDGGGIFGGLFGGGETTSTGPITRVPNPVLPPDGKRGFGSLEPLLALIRKHESRGNYDAYYTGVSSPPPRRLTTMSVAEVLAWQDRIDRTSPSEAAGAYQILEDTLRGLVRKGKVFLESPYDKATQDSLAKELLFGRGLQRYRSGQISANTFANNIAKEWASFPVVTGSKAGRSFYAGDGLNRSSVSVSKSLAAVRAI